MKNPFIKNNSDPNKDLNFGINIHQGHFGVSFYIQLIFIEFACVAPMPSRTRGLLIYFKIPFIWKGYYLVIQFKNKKQ